MNWDLSTTSNIAGVAFGFFSFTFAIWSYRRANESNRQKERLEKFATCHVRNMARAMQSVRENARLVYRHIDDVYRACLDEGLTEAETLRRIRLAQHYGGADITVVIRLLESHIEQAVTMAEILYDEKIDLSDHSSLPTKGMPKSLFDPSMPSGPNPDHPGASN